MRLLLLGLLVAAAAHAQTGTISGTVRDAVTGEALPGASVLIEGMRLGAAADINGRFVIRDVPVGTYDVRFSFWGYHPITTTLALTDKAHFDAALTADLRAGRPLLDPADDWGYIPILDRSPMASRYALGDQIRRLPIGR